MLKTQIKKKLSFKKKKERGNNAKSRSKQTVSHMSSLNNSKTTLQQTLPMGKDDYKRPKASH